MVLSPPALRILGAAFEVGKGGLTRELAASANRSNLTTADDYLRALTKLGLLRRREAEGRRVSYHLSAAGRAFVARRPLR